MNKILVCCFCLITAISYSQVNLNDPELYNYHISLIEENFVLNKDLPEVDKQSHFTSAEQNAQLLLQALSSKDISVLNSFFPSQEIYIKMLVNFGFQKESNRTQALKNLYVNYNDEKIRVAKNLTSISNQIRNFGAISFVRYEMEMTENASIPGGRAAVVFQDANGVEHAFAIYKYYSWDNEWFVTNKIVWRY